MNAVNAALTGTGAGGITTGTTSAPAELIITDQGTSADTFTVSAIVQDNGAGGAVTLVKSGGGKTILTGANTHSGGTVVNAGILESQSTGSFGTGGITLAGGEIDLRNNAAATYANGLTVIGDGTVLVNNNSSGTGNDITLPTLAIGNQTLVVTNGNTYNLAISGATTLGGDATISSTGTSVKLLAAIGESGGARQFTKTGVASLQIGNGAADTTANTWTGGLRLWGGTTNLNKAAGTVAVPGNITLIGDGAAANTGVLATTLNLNFNEQIGDTASVTINGGTFNVKSSGGTGVTETMGTLAINGGGIAGFLRTSVIGTVQANVANARLSVSDLALSHQGNVSVVHLFTGTTGTEGVLTLRGNLSYAGAGGLNGIDTNPTVICTTGAPIAGQTRGTLSLASGDHTFTVGDIDGITEEVRIDALIAGSGKLIKSGAGRVGLNVTLNENNTFSGGVRVDAGDLHARATSTGTGNPLGTGTTTLNGGRLFLAFNGAASSGTIANISTVPFVV